MSDDAAQLTEAEAAALREQVTTLQGIAATQEFQLETFTERLAELELSLEDIWWVRVAGNYNLEFSRGGLRRIIEHSRLLYLKNPLIARAVDVKTHYVWGQGVTIQARDEQVNEVIQAFLTDPRNSAAFTGHQARMYRETQLDVEGNLFCALFPDSKTGAVQIRTIPVDEIEDIITNPEDRMEAWYYRRSYTEQMFSTASGTYQPTARISYYPDWRYTPTDKPATIGGQPVLWNAPVMHVRVGGLPDMRFGLPETYAAHDWAMAYKQALENTATRLQALARFAWKFSTKGGTSGISSIKDKLATTLGNNVGNSAETNPPPTSGAAFIATQGVDLSPFNVSGTMWDPQIVRPFRLMVAAATGLPETFFGDADVGNYATSKTLDRPTELMMEARRQLWIDVYQDLLQWVIDRAALSNDPRIPRSAANAQTTALTTVGSNENNTSVDRYIEIKFPSLLEHDVVPLVNAIVSAATLNGSPDASTIPTETLSELLLEALGLDDIDEIMDALKKQQAEEKRQAQAQAKTQADAQAARLAQQQQQPQTQDPQEPAQSAQTTQQAEALFYAAVQEMRTALVEIRENEAR